MTPDNEFGLSTITNADEVLLTRAIVQVQRRVQLEKILDSLLSQCEAEERDGLRIWNWELSVTERKGER